MKKEKAFPKAMRKPSPSTSGPQSAPTSSAPPAMTRLGRLYEKGLGCPKDTAKAEELYQKAAEAGYEEAKTDLARLHG